MPKKAFDIGYSKDAMIVILICHVCIARNNVPSGQKVLFVQHEHDKNALTAWDFQDLVMALRSVDQ